MYKRGSGWRKRRPRATPASAQPTPPDRALVEDVVAANPIYHMSSFLGAGVPIFEIREAGGDGTDMLVRNPALGAALAQKLGNSTVLLMRGHGDVVVGDSVRQAVFRAIYTETNAKLQSEALRLGQGTFLNGQEAAAAMATHAALVERAQELRKAEAAGAR